MASESVEAAEPSFDISPILNMAHEAGGLRAAMAIVVDLYEKARGDQILHGDLVDGMRLALIAAGFLATGDT